MDYETERQQLDTEYKAAHAAALEAVSAVVDEFGRRTIRLMEKYGIKNRAVALVEQGHIVTSHGYPDGSWWYEVDGESYDYDSEDVDLTRAIREAIDLELIVEDVTYNDLYSERYMLPVKIS